MKSHDPYKKFIYYSNRIPKNFRLKASEGSQLQSLSEKTILDWFSVDNHGEVHSTLNYIPL
jgi:hypothetical protein